LHPSPDLLPTENRRPSPPPPPPSIRSSPVPVHQKETSLGPGVSTVSILSPTSNLVLGTTYLPHPTTIYDLTNQKKCGLRGVRCVFVCACSVIHTYSASLRKLCSSASHYYSTDLLLPTAIPTRTLCLCVPRETTCLTRSFLSVVSSGARPALSCPALPCPALPCPALPCPALSVHYAQIFRSIIYTLPSLDPFHLVAHLVLVCSLVAMDFMLNIRS